ncbi:MAG: hypothetical protein RLY31_713 [Bacteroidota bacterium]
MKKANFTNQSYLPQLKLVFSALLVGLAFNWSVAQSFTGSTTNTAGNSSVPSAGTGGCFAAPQTTGGTDFPVNVSCVGSLGGGVTVSNVTINLTHTWDGDVDIYLVSPGGDVLELSTGNGGSADNYTNTVFTDAAASFITAGAAPFTGSYRPEGRQNVSSCNPSNLGALGTHTFGSTFTSGSADGTWYLRLFDNAGGDSGTLNSWSISFSGGAAASCDFVGGPTLPALNLSTSATNCESDPIAVPATTGDCAGVVVSYAIGAGSYTDLAPGQTTIPGLPAGNTTINWRSVNACNQVGTASQAVNVSDLVDPVINCPSDIFINLAPGECDAFVNYSVTASDNCPFAGPSGTVNTINTGGNQGSAGGMVYFNINNLSGGDITITELGVRVSAPTIIEVYTKAGTYVGSTGNAGAWTLAGTADATAGPASPAFTGVGPIAPAPTSITIPAGLNGIALRAVSAQHQYTNGNGANQFFTDGLVELILGGASNTPWGGLFSPRIFNGYVTYETFSVSPDPVLTAGQASGTQFGIGTVTNCYEITDAQGNSSSCCFDVTVVEYANATNTLACNDHVQISLDESCSAVVGADDILEGGPYGCYETRYTVMILSPLGANLGNVVNANFIGQEWTVKVVDNNTGQSCWGHITVEDKLKPVVSCEDLTLPCTAPSTAVGATALFSTSNTPVSIFDNQTATADIPVAGLPADARILDVDVTIDISHTWIGDLDVDILSPAGTRFRAWNQDCANTANIKVTLDDEDPDCYNACAAYVIGDTVSPIACLLAQFPGFSDVDFLNVFDGETANGNWTVRVTDFFAGDQGTINNVTLAITYFSATAVYQPTVTDNCGPVTVSSLDATIEDGCGGPSRTIVRTWVAEDASGNVSDPCVQTITFARPTLNDVDVPADVVWTCDQYNANNGVTAASNSASGVPTVSGRPLEDICDIGVEYEDVVVPVCPGSFKIIRQWTLIDWCATPVDVREINQVVKVVDDAAPSITAPADQTINVYDGSAQSGDPHAVCEGTIAVPPATGVADNCSGVTGTTTEIWTANSSNQPVTQLGAITGNGGVFTNIPLYVNGLPAKYVVRYYAVDGCGNQSFDDAVYTLRDKVPPVAICDEITEIAITNNSVSTGGGCSTLHAESLDDGSYDNCAPVYYLIAKMDDSFSPTIFNRCYYPSRDFCCEDIGTQNVILLVLDGDPSAFFTSINQPALGCDGTPGLLLSATANYPFNYNTCMVEVNVVDKLPPVLTSCPPNQRITCDFYADNFETALQGLSGAEISAALTAAGYGSASFYDNCQANVSSNANINIDQCLEGTITRTWTAQDGSGNNATSSCNQTIFVDHVSDWVVEFPADLTVNCGASVPDFGEPEIFGETCELVGVSYNDVVYNVVPDACYKIERTWTLINWCVVGSEIDQEVVESTESAMNLDLDGDGDKDTRTFRDSWTTTSKPAAAQATQSTNPDTDSDSDPWDGYITYKQVIKVNDTVDPVFTAGCSIPDVCIEDNSCGGTVLLPEPDITECSPNVTLTAKVRIGGVWLSGFGPYLNVAPGTYEVLYNAMDNCNNQKDCSTTVTVKDCKKPTPYCKNGLVIEIMQSGMITVNAADFDAGSYDNCTAQGQLLLSLSANTSNTSATFDCDQLGQNVIQLWVTDAAGNQDYCETFIEVQDNMGACNDDPLVAGTTATESNTGVQGVSINFNSPSGFSANTTTDAAGSFNVAVPSAGDYTITPVLDLNPLNGVSTFDLVLISKHILGVQALDSPYKIIAADANKSNSVTTFDLVEIRKLILFINSDFPNNTSWRFVPKSFNFASNANPFSAQFPEVINLNDLTAESLANDFVAIKVGDVNGSAAVSFTGSSDERTMTGDLVLNTEDVLMEAGQNYTVSFKATEFAVSGYQFTLAFDRESLEFVEIGAGMADASNFGLSLLNEGVITTSWNSDAVKELDADEAVFSLTFKATRSGRLSNMVRVNSQYTAAEAYRANGELLNVALTFDHQTVAGGFELYQNTPNPFANVTNIGFYLPEATSATLTISDVQGKVVSVMQIDGAKGYNQVNLKRSEFGATGVLYYSLKTATDAATRKMILVD